MQSHTHAMQQTHMHKAVTRHVEAKKLLSRRRQSNYSFLTISSHFSKCKSFCDIRRVFPAWWEKMGNLGSSFPGNIDMWREILEIGEILPFFVHKNTIQIGENWACFPGNKHFFILCFPDRITFDFWQIFRFSKLHKFNFYSPVASLQNKIGL